MNEAYERERAMQRRMDPEGQAAAVKVVEIPAAPSLPPDEHRALVEAIKRAPAPTGKLIPITLTSGRVPYEPEVVK